MKIAHLLFGMSNTSHYVYWRKKHGYHPIITINYKDTFSNQKDMLLNCFTGSEVDIFFSTYDNKKKNKIIKHYNPKKYIFIDKYIPNGTIARNTHFTNALKLCIDYSEENNVKYDFIIINRFDLKFLIKLTECDIDYTKINCVSTIAEHLYREKLIDDCFYLVPFSKLKDFYEINMRDITQHSHHYIEDYKKIGFHLIFKETTYTVGYTPLFRIYRKKICNLNYSFVDDICSDNKKKKLEKFSKYNRSLLKYIEKIQEKNDKKIFIGFFDFYPLKNTTKILVCSCINSEISNIKIYNNTKKIRTRDILFQYYMDFINTKYPNYSIIIDSKISKNGKFYKSKKRDNIPVFYSDILKMNKVDLFLRYTLYMTEFDKYNDSKIIELIKGKDINNFCRQIYKININAIPNYVIESLQKNNIQIQNFFYNPEQHFETLIHNIDTYKQLYLENNKEMQNILNKLVVILKSIMYLIYGKKLIILI